MRKWVWVRDEDDGDVVLLLAEIEWQEGQRDSVKVNYWRAGPPPPDRD